jgi:hypothetical protein
MTSDIDFYQTGNVLIREGSDETDFTSIKTVLQYLALCF